jgi:hypothetical protein
MLTAATRVVFMVSPTARAGAWARYRAENLLDSDGSRRFDRTRHGDRRPEPVTAFAVATLLPGTVKSHITDVTGAEILASLATVSSYPE